MVPDACAEAQLTGADLSEPPGGREVPLISRGSQRDLVGHCLHGPLFNMF